MVADLHSILAADAALRKELKSTAWWFDDDDAIAMTGIAHVSGDTAGGIWTTGGDAGITLVTGDVRADNVIIAGHASNSTVIFLGALRAQNLFLAPDTNVYVVGALEITGLMYVASRDASFTTLGPATIGVLYSGHSAAWLTARKATTIDVLDDYVEGTKPTVLRKRVLASSLVIPSLVRSDKPQLLERDEVFNAMTTTTALLGAAPTPTKVTKPAKPSKTAKATKVKRATKKTAAKRGKSARRR